MTEEFGTLIGGGDCQDHYHQSDRFPPREATHWQYSLEVIYHTAISTSIPDTADIVISTSAGPITITLPYSRNGRRLEIARTGAGAVTLVARGTEIISGSTTLPVRLKAIDGGWLSL